ncbi:hypothetical protein OA84_08975 [Kaistella solincola]|uniref:Uncharacterized protein n=1 Tax=Kaistella solincola TaxID=510955 RepID=A0ABR4ZR50_9FLAO|nr:hypothetical protein [Kaistella solincola]KIA83616.1 hypothetical protein OA84_08975 [Kaistella solincola]
MTSIITGLFRSQSLAPIIALDLENAGVKKSSYILYLHPIAKEIKTSLWNYFFKDNLILQDDSLVVSVKAKTPERKESVQCIFCGHECLVQNYFENIKFKDARSLEYLHRLAAIRAKAQIYSLPPTHHHISHEGMSSEINFGRA